MERKKRITKEQQRQLEILKDMLVNGSNEEKAAIANLLEKREKQAKLDELLKKHPYFAKLEIAK